MNSQSQDCCAMGIFWRFLLSESEFSEFKKFIELDIPRAKAARQLPRAFKQNLLDRAQQLYPVAMAA